MSKVIGINGRKGEAGKPRVWIMQTCECGWPHFRWLYDEKDKALQAMVCASCDTTYNIREDLSGEGGTDE